MTVPPSTVPERPSSTTLLTVTLVPLSVPPFSLRPSPVRSVALPTVTVSPTSMFAPTSRFCATTLPCVSMVIGASAVPVSETVPLSAVKFSSPRPVEVLFKAIVPAVSPSVIVPEEPSEMA